jgi:epoxide hydrolase 4
MRFLVKFFYYPQYPTKLMVQKYKEAWNVPGALEASVNWYRYTVQRRPVIPDDKIHVPLLILWGAEDRALAIEGARASVNYCTNCSLKEFKGVGHFIQHAIPDVVSKEASEFFFGKK